MGSLETYLKGRTFWGMKVFPIALSVFIVTLAFGNLQSTYIVSAVLFLVYLAQVWYFNTRIMTKGFKLKGMVSFGIFSPVALRMTLSSDELMTIYNISETTKEKFVLNNGQASYWDGDEKIIVPFEDNRKNVLNEGGEAVGYHEVLKVTTFQLKPEAESICKKYRLVGREFPKSYRAAVVEYQ